MTGKEVLALANLPDRSHTKRFELWKWYDRQDGKRVQVIEVRNDGWFDGVRCDDGAECEARYVPTAWELEAEALGDMPKRGSSGWRYNRDSDRGRATGSAFDFSDPFNLVPENK